MLTVNQVKNKYRQVFNTPNGRIVFNHMLKELSFYTETGGDSQKVALNDYAKRLMAYVGIFDPKNFESETTEFVNVAFKAPFHLKE